MAEENDQRSSNDPAPTSLEANGAQDSHEEHASPLRSERKSSPNRSEGSQVSQSEDEDGEVSEDSIQQQEQELSEDTAQPLLPDEPTPPPLPDEPPPALQDAQDDGWEPVWDDANQAFYFYNRFTQVTQWENPRVPAETQPTNHDRIAAPARTIASDGSKTAEQELHPAVAGGYNPAIHGSYDPNAPYAQYAAPVEDTSDAQLEALPPGINAADYTATAQFNRYTGRFQDDSLQPTNYNDENKTRRQMHAFFDVDAAANSHDGRSLKAERAGKKLTKEEVKHFRERRRERKEEKRRAWLRD